MFKTKTIVLENTHTEWVSPDTKLSYSHSAWLSTPKKSFPNIAVQLFGESPWQIEQAQRCRNGNINCDNADKDCGTISVFAPRSWDIYAESCVKTQFRPEITSLTFPLCGAFQKTVEWLCQMKKKNISFQNESYVLSAVFSVSSGCGGTKWWQGNFLKTSSSKVCHFLT